MTQQPWESDFSVPSPDSLKVVAGADPAANAEVAPFVVPAGRLWRPMAFSVVLVQGITQTPRPTLVFDDGATIYSQISSTVQAVSTTARYTWTKPSWERSIGTTPDIHVTVTMPDLVMLAGHRIRTLTPGLGANSDYGVPILYVIEYG
jgi:hypothetical protein